MSEELENKTATLIVDGETHQVKLMREDSASALIRAALAAEEDQSKLLLRALQQIIDHPHQKAVMVRVEIARAAIARYHANAREPDKI